MRVISTRLSGYGNLSKLWELGEQGCCGPWVTEFRHDVVTEQQQLLLVNSRLEGPQTWSLQCI